MKCNEVSELLSAYADDEIAGRKAAEVKAHLEQCADCRANLDALNALRGKLVDMANEPVECVDISELVMASLPLRQKPPVARWTWGLAAAAVVLIAFVGLSLQMMQSKAPKPAGYRVVEKRGAMSPAIVAVKPPMLIESAPQRRKPIESQPYSRPHKRTRMIARQPKSMQSVVCVKRKSAHHRSKTASSDASIELSIKQTDDGQISRLVLTAGNTHRVIAEGMRHKIIPMPIREAVDINRPPLRTVKSVNPVAALQSQL